jgi:hypothetical protein
MRLVDVLVAAVILLLALCFILPAMQQPIDRSYRLRCQNNLREMAFACHNCNDTFGSMPPYRAGAENGVPKSSYFGGRNEGTLFYFLLPFVEHNSLYQAGTIAGSEPRAYSAFATMKKLPEKPYSEAYEGTGTVSRPPKPPFVGQAEVSTFTCWMDPAHLRDGPRPALPWGACSFACNYLVFGNQTPGEGGKPPLENPDGFDPKAKPAVRAPNALPRLVDSFPDGTGNTLLFTEKLSTCQWFQAGSTTVAQPGGNLWAWPGDNASFAPAFAMESPWNDGTRFQLRPEPGECNVAYPSANHSSLTVAFADTSGRLLSANISAATWTALCTPKGGEALNLDDF